MRRGSEFDPAVVQRDNKLSTLQLHVDLTPTEQHHGIYAHHTTVTDEHSTGLHFLMVHEVRTVIVTHLHASDANLEIFMYVECTNKR